MSGSRKKIENKSGLPEMMTKHQVADYFGVSVKTVERMMHSGLESSSFKPRGKRYFYKQSIAAYLEKNLKK